jgi:hypothetical protein
MNTHHAMWLPLAGLLALADPLPAQGHGQSPLKLIYAVWGDATGAPNAIAGLDKHLRDQIEAYAILAKDPDGSVEIRAKHERDDFSAPSVEASQTIESVVALLNAPAPVDGNRATRISAANVAEMKDLLKPGESALLLMAPRPPIPELRRSLGMDPGDAEVVEVEVLS